MKLCTFVSHSWSEADQYRALLKNIYSKCKNDFSVEDLSVDRDQALDLSKHAEESGEVGQLKRDIAQLYAELDRLSTPVVRIVWDAQGNRIEQTDHLDLLRRISGLKSRYHELMNLHYRQRPYDHIMEQDLHRLRRQDIERRFPKGTPRSLGTIESPVLAEAISERILAADVVLLLSTPLCLYRSWVRFEVDVASTNDIPIIGVHIDSPPNHEVVTWCNQVVPMCGEPDLLIETLRRYARP